MFLPILIILPVLLAGLTFILVLKFLPNFLNTPLDLYKTYRGKRIFGDNKTLKGPLIMGVFTGVYGLFIYTIVQLPSPSSVFYSYMLIGFLYSLGELPNSFIKRQLDIAPGKKTNITPWKIIFTFLDIYDSLIFCFLGYIFIFNFDPLITFITILLSGGIHFATDILMKLLKLKH